MKILIVMIFLNKIYILISLKKVHKTLLNCLRIYCFGLVLGLIICKEFIEKHGGKIWVESVTNEGSCFNFSLPDNSFRG